MYFKLILCVLLLLSNLGGLRADFDKNMRIADLTFEQPPKLLNSSRIRKLNLNIHLNSFICRYKTAMS